MKTIIHLLKSEMNLPNALSLSRIGLSVIYLLLICFSQSKFVLLSIITLSCATDILDGYIARKYNQVTLLGKILDPLADKVFQFSIMLGFLVIDFHTIFNFIIFVMVELSLVRLAVFLINKDNKFVSSNSIGKRITVWFFSIIIFTLIFNLDVVIITSLISISCVYRLINYVYEYLRTEKVN